VKKRIFENDEVVIRFNPKWRVFQSID